MMRGRYPMTAPGEDHMPLPARPRDPIALAKLIGDMSVGDVPVDHAKPDEAVPEPTGPAKGGAQRAASLSAQRRREIAKQGAAARWGA